MEPFCLTKDQILQIVHSLETMLEIFESQMAMFDSVTRVKFLESKNRIHLILADSMGEKIG